MFLCLKKYTYWPKRNIFKFTHFEWRCILLLIGPRGACLNYGEVLYLFPPPAGAFYAVVSHSAWTPVKMWSITVLPATKSSTYTNVSETVLNVNGRERHRPADNSCPSGGKTACFLITMRSFLRITSFSHVVIMNVGKICIILRKDLNDISHCYVINIL